MTYIKINGQQYEASIFGKRRDTDWRDASGNPRDSKAITLPMTYAEAMATFVDDTPWSILQQDASYVDPETGSTVTPDPVEYDNADYCVAGSVTDNRNGTVTVKMGKMLDSEKLAALNAEYEKGVAEA